MNKSSRRRFIADSGKAAMAGSLLINLDNKGGDELKNIFIHHVYFWLKSPDSKEDLAKLIEGLKKLSAVKTIRKFHIGKPADTKRDVIDTSYAISWLAFFDNKGDQDSYQTDPIHLKFVEDYSALWTRVVVYDSVAV